MKRQARPRRRSAAAVSGRSTSSQPLRTAARRRRSPVPVSRDIVMRDLLIHETQHCAAGRRGFADRDRRRAGPSAPIVSPPSGCHSPLAANCSASCEEGFEFHHVTAISRFIRKAGRVTICPELFRRRVPCGRRPNACAQPREQPSPYARYVRVRVELRVVAPMPGIELARSERIAHAPPGSLVWAAVAETALPREASTSQRRSPVPLRIDQAKFA
jgi:hypothetical protein